MYETIWQSLPESLRGAYLFPTNALRFMFHELQNDFVLNFNYETKHEQIEPGNTVFFQVPIEHVIMNQMWHMYLVVGNHMVLKIFAY